MPRAKSLALSALLVGLVFSQAATAKWLHYTNGVSQADSPRQKHPRALSLVTSVPTDVAGPTVCLGYESNHRKGQRGRILGTARIDRADGSTETLNYRGTVDDNFFLECEPAAAPIAAGDLVTFDFGFNGLPKQKMIGGRSDFFSINGIVSNLGAPGPRSMPPGVNPPALGGHIYASISMFAADRNRQNLPTTLTQSVLMAADAATPVICAALGNTAAKGNRGRVITTATVMHQDGSETNLEYSGRVRGNIYTECQLGPSLVAGDIVLFEHELKRFPRLSVEGGFFDVAAVYGVISPDGIPMVRAGF